MLPQTPSFISVPIQPGGLIHTTYPSSVPGRSSSFSYPAQRFARRRGRVPLAPCSVAEPLTIPSTSPSADSRSSKTARLKISATPHAQAVAFPDSLDQNGNDLPGSSSSSGDGKVGKISHFRVGMPHTEETRQKISEANKGKVPWNKGVKHSPETKRKIAEATRRAMNSPVTRARLRSLARGRKHSDSTKNKIALSCGRSQALRFEKKIQAESKDAEGKDGYVRRPVFGNVLARDNKRRPSPFPWTSETIANLHDRIHARASMTDFKRIRTPSQRVGATRSAMKPETREKLSCRIKELWADPEYRRRVVAGYQDRQKRGYKRAPLSSTHRERIRQSLLRRNAELKGSDRLRSTKEAVVPGERKARRRPSREYDPREGTKLASQIPRDDRTPEKGEKDRLVVRERLEEEAKEENIRNEEPAVTKRTAADQKAKRQKKFAKEAAKRAADQRVQDKLLLEVLASSGQLPPLSGSDSASLVSGTLPSSHVIFDEGGLRSPGENGLFESVSKSQSSNNPGMGASRLVFSSGGGWLHAEQSSSHNSASTTFVPSEPLLDFDIYSPPAVLADDDEEDDSGDNRAEVDANKKKKKRTSSSQRRPSRRLLTRDFGSEDIAKEGVVGGGSEDEKVVDDVDVDSVLAEVAQAVTPAESLRDSVFPDHGAPVLFAETDSADESGEEDDGGNRGFGPNGILTETTHRLHISEGRGKDGDDSDAIKGSGDDSSGVDNRKRVVTYVDGAAQCVRVD